MGTASCIIFLQLKFFFSPIIRVHHLLNSLVRCSECNSVLNGVGSNDFKVSRHQNFEILGFQGLAAYHNFEVLGFQSPTTKKTCKVQDPSRSQTLDSVNPGSRIFLGPWHKSVRKVDFSHPTGHHRGKKSPPPLQKTLGAPLDWYYAEFVKILGCFWRFMQ